MPQILLALRGLPASGKSTYAKALVAGEEKLDAADKNTKWVRVNKDDLRNMIHNGKWGQKNEDIIKLARNALIKSSLSAGYNVVVDDTNFSDRHIVTFKEIAKQYGVEFKVHDFDVDFGECVKRDLKRIESVGKDVIFEMHQKFIRPKLKVDQNVDLPQAVIFDIDGTLALIGDRDPYDAASCEKDEQNVFVCSLLRYIHKYDSIIITSGRPDTYREQTIRWLDKNCLPYTALFMRKEGDCRKDCIVKKEIFMNLIKPNWYVKAVFDDRDQVCRLWRDLGLTCLQVADGNF